MLSLLWRAGGIFIDYSGSILALDLDILISYPTGIGLVLPIHAEHSRHEPELILIVVRP